MENQNNRNFTRENEDRFLFKKPAVPLFPAAASSTMGPGANASNEKPNPMKQENLRPGQPFWKMLTQSDKSPLHSVNQGEGGPSFGMGNNQNMGIVNDGGGPFRRNFRGAGELPPFMPPRDIADVNPFLRDLSNSQPLMEGSSNRQPLMQGNNNRSTPQTFDYNHGVSGSGGPAGPFMGPRDIPEGGRPPEPRPLMEVTIPNPAALFQKLHAKLDKKDDPSPGRDQRQQGQRQSPRQRNDSQRRQPGPSNRQGNQGKQKGSPNKGGKAQNEAWNRGLKRMSELQNQLIECDQVAKKKKTETASNKKGSEQKSMEPPVLEYDAETLKLIDAISQGSQQHQLQLIKATGIKENFTGRALTPWMCYMCNTETSTWQAYVTHCKTKEHKSQAIGLGTTFMKDEKTKLLTVLRKLPFTRVSFSIETTGKTNSEGGPATGSNSSSPPVLAEAVGSKKGMHECKPCGRFFLQRERMQNHMKSEGHMKREAYLKQRYGNSWLDYHWYNQAKRTERRDAEPQGVAFVLPVSGYFCKLCSRFYNSEITAKDVHCRQIGHIDKVKEWDRQQLTKKEAIKLKLNVAEIETAVQKKEELTARISRWSRPKLSSNSAEVVVVDSDPEDESDKKKSKDGKGGKTVANSIVRKVGLKIKDEDLEEGELSEAEVLRMEKQEQEDKIKEEWMKREAKKKEKEQREREQREKERREKEAQERKEREAREEKVRKQKEAIEERLRKEREAREEKLRKAKEEREKREKERLEREKIMKKLQEEKRQLEQQKKEFQQQVEREKKEKEHKERLEKEAKEKQEKARKLQEEQDKRLRETRMREMLELETRIRQQEKRERELLEERVRLGQMLAMSTGTPDRAFIERDMRDKEIRGRVVREQLDKDIKQLEEMKRVQLEQVAPDITAREEDTRAKVEAEMKKAEEKRLREERLKEVEKREKELQEIEKREQERQRIEEKERELLEIEMRDMARREQELQEREQEMFAIRELERKARLEEEMQARRQHEMQARREQEMKVRQEQEMKTRQEQEMKARQEQEMQARHEQEMLARREQEMKGRQEQEMQARQEQEMKARQEQEMEARREMEMQAIQEQEMQARREQEMQARQEQEVLRMREQEILARREQDIQAWHIREAQMVAEGVSEVDILQQRQVFQQQLEEKYAREGPLPVGDMTREAMNPEMERELFLSELRQKARGELMMKAMQLQRQGLTDADIQEVMAREEEIMKERIFEEMQRRGFTDVGVSPGHGGAREIDPAAEQGMAFAGDERDQEDGRRDREWTLREQEMIERERRSRDREMRQRSPERDYDERDNVRYVEEAGGRSIEGGRDDTLRYDMDYPPSPDNYGEDDYYSDEGSYEEGEGDVGDEYDNVQGSEEDERFQGINRDGMRGVASRRDSVPRQGRPPVQRIGDRRRRRKRGGRGQRRRQGRGGPARRGR